MSLVVAIVHHWPCCYHANTLLTLAAAATAAAAATHFTQTARTNLKRIQQRGSQQLRIVSRL
jgi:hypothetical protein